jgi:hypothetical protein
MAKALYILTILLLNLLIYTEEWASAYLSAVIVLTYLTFRPKYILHPNNMIMAFFGLYIVLSSLLNLFLHLVGWTYVTPGGQQVFWNELSKYTLFQAEFTFLILYFGLHIFTGRRRTTVEDLSILTIRKSTIFLLFGINAILVFWFLESTAGISVWINDYSYTYLTRREGHGLLNFVSIAIGNVLIFTLGVWTHRSQKKLTPIILAIIAIGLQSFAGGFKGRLILLLIFFFSSWLMHKQTSLKMLLGVTFTFFSTLYLATLFRTEGYYASPSFFLEMLISYFNAYQLHDWIVISRDPGLFQTTWQVFTKPLQILGLASLNMDFDISVMLTKEFFPDHWFLEKATQQWPLDSELYLNYFGFYLSWIPLLIYAFVMSQLFIAAVIRQNQWLMPVFIAEFIRIFSMLRGTLIPWDIFILAVQYPFVYLIAKCCLPKIKDHRPSSRKKGAYV